MREVAPKISRHEGSYLHRPGSGNWKVGVRGKAGGGGGGEVRLGAGQAGGKRSRGGGGPAKVPTQPAETRQDWVGPVRQQLAKRRCVYTTQPAQFEFVRCNTRSLVKTAQDGRRQGRKGLWKGEAEGGLKERQGWTPVPRRKVGILYFLRGFGWLV